MLDKLLKFTGTATLYTCTSLFLAGAILGLYLKYAWQIDHDKWVKMLAIAQGLELSDIQEEVKDRIASINYNDVLERRAARIRNEEFERESIEKNTIVLPPPAPEPEPDEKTAKKNGRKNSNSKKDTDDISAFEKKVKEELDKQKAAGIAEETRLLEKAEPEQAKDVFKKLWKDGKTERVLTLLLGMEEKNRGEILYAMKEDEELKDLCDILEHIGNGEPMATAVEKAAKEVKEGK